MMRVSGGPGHWAPESEAPGRPEAAAEAGSTLKSTVSGGRTCGATPGPGSAAFANLTVQMALWGRWIACPLPL